MKIVTKTACLMLFAISMIFIGSEAVGQEPGWHPRVIVRGQTREIIKNTPIECRPYRPLHFYGNTIRRKHYRGNPLPLPKDIVRTAFNLVRR